MMYNADRAEGPFTIEEFEALPEEDAYRVELVRGMLVREPRPAAMHAWVQSRVAVRLGGFVEEQRLGYLFTDVGVIVSRHSSTVRGPDLAFVAAARLPAGPRSGFLDLAPDLCIEIVSPSNRPAAIEEKVLEYLSAGTSLVWVIDPAKRTVVERRPGSAANVRATAEELSGADVVPGFVLNLAELFGI
ncbi:MAG: Uma2 family endonuclease [Longimicrobiales bacterium]